MVRISTLLVNAWIILAVLSGLLTVKVLSRSPETEAKARILLPLLVSTYVVCERLSVMHEPAGVVEILVQILPEYPLF